MTKLFLVKITVIGATDPLISLDEALAKMTGNEIDAYSFDEIKTPNIDKDENCN